MNAVVHGVVSLDVPAVIVLIHAIAVNPEDGGMLFCTVEIFGNKEPCGNLLAVGAGIVDELRFDKTRALHLRGHGVGDSNGLRAFFRSDRVEIGAVVRVGVLVNEAAIAFGPVRINVGSRSWRKVCDFCLGGIIANGGDADYAVAGMIFKVGVEGDARAVVGPRGTPRFELALGDLHGFPAG